MDETLRSRLEAAVSPAYVVELEDRRAHAFLARDAASGEMVVIKTVPDDLAAGVDINIFQREISALAMLDEPHVVPVIHAAQSADGLLSYVMPYVEGETLRHHLGPGPLPVDIVVKILHDVAAALEYAHGHGADHRALTVDSVWLSPDAAMLIDVGIARAVALAKGEEAAELDVVADLFAWGVLADELLSGAHAFTEHLTSERRVETQFAVLPTQRMITKEREAPAALSALVLQSLAKDVQSRPRTAHDLVLALEAAWWTSNLVPAARTKKKNRKPLWLAAGGAVAAIVLAIVMFRVMFTPQEAITDDENPEIRVGMLPLYNEGAPDDDYIVDGVSEGIRSRVAAIPTLQVIGRASSLQYKGSTKGLKIVGAELNVRFMVIGSLRREKVGTSSRLKIQTALMEVRSGHVMWKEVHDVSPAELFDAEGKIATNMAGVLKIPLTPAQRTKLFTQPTENVAAYEAFLRGENISEGLTVTDLPPMRKAIAEYEKAVSLDPSFALAWARLARAHILALPFGSSSDADAAGRASERAMSIAPQRWESQWARGLYYDEVARDHKRARAAQLEATRLSPESADAWDGLSLAQGYNGNWEEARASAEHALTLDPRSVESTQRAADALTVLGQNDEASKKLLFAESIDPLNPHVVFRLMLVRLAEVNREGSREEMRESTALKDDVNLFVGGRFAPWMLDPALQDRLIALKPEAYVEGRGRWALTLAQIYSLRGDFVRARAFADSARASLEGARRDAMNDFRIDRELAQAYSILNRHDATLSVGTRSLAELPNKSDRIEGAWNQYLVARTYVGIGEKEEALRLLDEILTPGSYVQPGWVRLDPAFASLSGNAHFERLTTRFP